MIVIRLRGGLGNQMFQYAFGKRMAQVLDTSIKLDLTSLLKPSKRENVTPRNYQLDIFNINEPFLIQPKLLKTLYRLNLNFVVQIIKGIKLIGIKTMKEKTFIVEQHLIDNPSDNTLYSGYWQSELYFKDADHLLRQNFKFVDPLSKNAQEILDHIENNNSVCIHIRRGDYVGNSVFNNSSLDYFYDAAKYIKQERENLHFFVFSDDPKWCQEHVHLDSNFTIVDYDTDKLKFKEDLQLMSACSHFIMSASSFSWWAVWLSTGKQKIVVAPKQWFLDDFKDTTDLISNDWIRL